MSAALQLASRNAAVLRWWSDCSTPFRAAARACYAAWLGCPDCELGNPGYGTHLDFAQDPDVLDWLTVTYPHTIAAHAEDHSQS